MAISFASPIILVALLIPAAIAFWLLTGQVSRAVVPNVALWQEVIGPGKASSRLRRPPAWAALLLLAAAIAIVAAAGPSRPSAATTAGRWPVVESVAVRRGQAMVRLRGGSTSTQVELAAQADNKPLGSAASAVQPGETQDVFLDVPDGQSMQIVATCDRQTISIATVTPVPGGMRAVAIGNVADSIGRMIDTYNRHRPPTSEQIIAIGNARDVPTGPAVVLADASPMPLGLKSALPSIDVSPSAIVAGIGWQRVLATARWGGPLPGDVWTPLVRFGGQPIVASRSQPSRQVWIGFTSADFERSPAFVVFWTNLLDWIACDQPGYRVTIEPGSDSVATAATTVDESTQSPAGRPLAPICLVLAAALSAIAAAVARGDRS